MTSPRVAAPRSESAFVVQIQPSRRGGADTLCGRVEHLASGTETRFSSAEELLTFLRSLVPASESERK